MKIELKDFQETAKRSVLEELEEARTAVRRGKLQAVVLSAPTGSGKTITVAAVIDEILGGGDGFAARPDTTFLWLSDSPELNQQSLNKLTAACDHLLFNRMDVISSDSFDQERLLPGHLYFINTQLLGKDKRLTQGGDKRQYTFWQTVANTVAEAPEDFVLIIDEAHRGAAANDRTRTPIMQKFILGSEADGLPPVPLVLGMSATPQRFTALLGNTNRTQRPVNISPDDVRESGLLKDLIIVHNPRTTAQTDLTLLEQAAGRWQAFTGLWQAYCDKEKERTTVRPILVVQVEDGTDKTITRTNLDDLVRVIERQSGPLALNEIVHCFQDQAEITAGGRIIRKIEASRIQDSPDVKVVLFKTALTTGWDCPRAEIMMSFRRAQELTSIAQLVGRMIRTPLARRIVSDEVLNTVELYLPHYDATSLEDVLNRLRSPDAEDGISTRAETEATTYPRNPDMAAVFEHLKALPTYAVNRAPKMGDVKRALRLANLLSVEGIDEDANDALRSTLIQKLKALRDARASSDSDWGRNVREGAEVDVDVTTVAIGSMAVSGRNSTRLLLSEENIDQRFDAAGRVLASGEGLHRTYWKAYHDHAQPNEAKLEVAALARDAEVLAELAHLARREFEQLWSANKPVIQALPAAKREPFQKLNQAGGKAVEEMWELPQQIVEKSSGPAWKQHLYCDASGDFHATLNTWESAVLAEAMKEPGFVGWLRNPSRGAWALCIPYDLGDTKAFYPDFVIVRQVKGNFVVDVVEPHDDSRADTWAKAKGLAIFADKHSLQFGRLMIARKRDEQLEYADMSEPTTREKARKMQSQNDLESLFR
jgi:type III restriction enzyme